MHQAEHVMRFGELKNWVSGGISAVMIFALCVTSALNDLNLQKWRKKSFAPLFLTMILPIILLLLLESYLDIGWIGIALYAGIAGFLFGVAWIPQLLNQGIARRLLRAEPMSGKQQAQIIEWIHFHPLKKLLVFGLWGFGVVLVLRGIWVTATGKIEMDGALFLFLLGTTVLVVALFQKMRRYICTPHYPVTAFGVVSGYWLDWNCPLCRYCRFPIWSCMDSTAVESGNCPPTFACGTYERQTAGTDY